ncbi:MAG: AAA-like domain-containing protein, partial [Acidobacteria bacterium]|nr:AAA-like domain-containing protein [Acidobacteriota bacterium]
MYQFQSGGALRPGSIYIKRQADQELYDKLRKSEFCYVLAPRQIGKSSLKVKVAERLIADGIACAFIDLLNIGVKSSTVDQWYYDLVKELADAQTGLNLQEQVKEFWETHNDDSVVRRWMLFLRNVVLKQISGNIVIFIDEIDSILSLKNRDASDDFFASIKGMYDLRAQLPDFQRLTFCLIGVAAPNDLIQDATRTPFNIGKPIRLNDFTEKETLGFKDGFQDFEGDSELLIREVFKWTNGHPYMTQKVCEELTFEDFESGISETDQVETIVQKCFLNLGQSSDTNLEYAEKRFNEKSSTTQKAQMLEVYRHLLNSNAVPLEENSASHLELRLTGLASSKVQEGKEYLQIRNKIFATVFNIDWVKEKEGNRFLADSIDQWIKSGKSNDYLLRGQALLEALEVSYNKNDLTKNEHDFLLASQSGETQQLIAEAEQRRAEEAERRAEAERLRAEEAQKHAEAMELQTRQFIYDFDIINAQQIIKIDSKRALELLENQIPKAGPNENTVPDLRGFEWYYLQEQYPWVLTNLTGHTASVSSVAFSPDGKRLATGSWDNTVKVWDVATWQAVATLTGHTDSVFSVAFSPDGNRLATGSLDNTVKVWDVATWQAVATLTGHTASVSSVAFSPDGNRLATGSWDNTVKVW